MQLEIKDKTYGLIWGTRAFRLAESRLNMTTQEILLSVEDENVIMNLTYCAMQNWLQDQDESATLPFTVVNFENWINEQTPEKILEITKDYLASTLNGKAIEKLYEEINAIYAATEIAKTSIVKKKK